MCINGIVIEGLDRHGCECKYYYSKILASESASSRADIQFLEIETFSQVKQSTRWVECIGPEEQRQRLRSYIANLTVNLWGHDLLQQWNTQINIPIVPPKLLFPGKILEDIIEKVTSHSGCIRIQSN